MPEVKPFQGLRFDPAKTGKLDHVVTPPYDVITPEERATLAEQSEHNMVHVILPEDEGGMSRYDVAAATFEAWLTEEALVPDAEPAYYLLRQRFTDLEGREQVRRGFFAVVKLPEPGENYILGHERTFSKPVEDRLQLTAATAANLGPVFVLYPDQERTLQPFLDQMDKRAPDLEARTIDGTQQELWRVADAPEVNDYFQDKTLYIADGHHRFQTACTYRDQMRKQQAAPGLRAYDYCLMGFVAFEDPGLQIYPPHRLVRQPEGFDAAQFLQALEPWFEIEQVSEALPDRVESAGEGCVLGLALHGGGNYLLRLRDIDRAEFLGADRGPAWRALDVAILHRGIIERVLGIPEGTVFEYEKSAARAMEAAQSGATGLAFILRATKKEQIRACAEAHEPMPQKSTYFFPKLPTGAVIYRLQ